MIRTKIISPLVCCILLFSFGCASQLEKRYAKIEYYPHGWVIPQNDDGLSKFLDSFDLPKNKKDIIFTAENEKLKHRIMEMLPKFYDAHSRYMLTQGKGEEESCPDSSDIDKKVAITITASPAPPGPVEPFFTRLSERGQEAVIKAAMGSDNNMDEKDLETLVNLLKTLQDGKRPSQGSPQTNQEEKIEIIISNHLNTGRPYDRIEHVTTYLFLDQEDAEFTDINMIESIFKEIDLGTATRQFQLSGTFGGQLGGIPLLPLGVPGTAGVNLSVSPEYLEKFERKFKEALTQRSVQIDPDRKWLRISQNSSQEYKIDGSIRHTVTIKSGSEELGAYYISLVSVRLVEKNGETFSEGDDEVHQHIAVKGGYATLLSNP